MGNGLSFEDEDNEGLTPLHCAVENDKTDFVKEAFSRGAGTFEVYFVKCMINE